METKLRVRAIINNSEGGDDDTTMTAMEMGMAMGAAMTVAVAVALVIEHPSTAAVVQGSSDADAAGPLPHNEWIDGQVLVQIGCRVPWYRQGGLGRWVPVKRS